MNRPTEPPQPTGTGPSSLRTLIRVVLLIVATGVAGVYLYVLSNPSQSLEVTILNASNELLRDVKVVGGSTEKELGEMGIGQRIAVTLPFTSSVELEFVGHGDIKRRATYPYEHGPSVAHRLAINLVSIGNNTPEGRQTVAKSSLMYGSEVTYDDPIDDMEIVSQSLDDPAVPAPPATPEPSKGETPKQP